MQDGSQPSARARRPLVFDLTHLVSRLPALACTGIDRIDLAYAMHFVGEAGMAAGLHYGLLRPHLYSVNQAREVVRLSGALWTSEATGAHGQAFAAMLDWLASPPRRLLQKPSRRPIVSNPSRATRRLHLYKGRILNNNTVKIPEGAIYLNVAQHLFEFPVFFRWLKHRRDLRTIFMIHDLLSLDYPEYFSKANLSIFRKRIATAFLHANAFIVSTQTVKTRLEQQLRLLGAAPRPIHVQPFPSPLEGKGCAPFAEFLKPGHPYFVMLGTIEPRKNHLLILHVWRELVARNPAAPRLVIVGARGWENEQVADVLDRSVALSAHILEISGLPSADLVELLRGALALLAPSFDEGYGLPPVEALSLGTPVVVSDIPVLREVTQQRATFLSPLNGVAWREVISRLTNDPAYAEAKRLEAAKFDPPTWTAYFRELDGFLAAL
jgi:glycosyltransferase involved in cell wall biosynthesis